MRKVTVAATQMTCTWDPVENIANAEKLIRQAAAAGAQIILLQELFERVYFCQETRPEFFDFATEMENNPAVQHFAKIAKELQVVLPISFFERKNKGKFNSIAIIDADGSVLGTYRKMHIPYSPGYKEKYYFSNGDQGFKVWDTKYARLGVAICWDQWFPEAARCMALKGAEIIMYPTAIGSEPQDAGIDSCPHWQRVMQGHSAANMVPIIASNRIGVEKFPDSEIKFYGSSFITDCTGDKVEEADRETETVLTHTFDLDAIETKRSFWGLFRDRRPEWYTPIMTLDGESSKN
ncbi:N-carbamoylputrescine amidase [Ethanoligenens sp.]|uniref:N-carbamoylputrescine amidase n=1 Tax=Ethanoligenens sp. TaxID=2099655 RepID=UPI0039E8CF93